MSCCLFADTVKLFHCINRDDFREGLIAGRQETVHPILYWLLRRKEDLKKRAYLARFLVKVDVAPEMRSDSDVMDLYEQVFNLNLT